MVSAKLHRPPEITQAPHLNIAKLLHRSIAIHQPRENQKPLPRKQKGVTQGLLGVLDYTFTLALYLVIDVFREVVRKLFIILKPQYILKARYKEL